MCFFMFFFHKKHKKVENFKILYVLCKQIFVLHEYNLIKKGKIPFFCRQYCGLLYHVNLVSNAIFNFVKLK
ncbi:MAG: hypothetical protein RL757_1055 [Bacteroidota bacterium]|jgi:hypothetical protein